MGITANLAGGELAQLLQSLEKADKSPFAWLLRTPPAATARVDGLLAGVGVLRTDDLHPKRTWAAIAVSPNVRRSGLGTAVYDALVELSPKPLKAKLRPSATAGRAFADALGLNVLVRSHVVRLDAARHVAQLTEGGGATAVEEVDSAHPDFRAAVAALYRRIHAWDPPATGADAGVGKDLCTDDVAFALAVRQGGKIIGVGLAHRSDGGSQLEAAMVGTVSPDDAGAPVTNALLAAVLRNAGELDVEVDEGAGAHDELLEIVRHLSPLPPEPTLIVGSD